MKEEVKKQWIEELRSGKWKQGKGTLHSTHGDTYCCLGVLCEIAVYNGVIGPAVLPKHASRFAYQGCFCGFLPPDVATWAGMELTHNGETIPNTQGRYDGGRYSLYEDNDAGKTFKEIADIIEKEF